MQRTRFFVDQGLPRSGPRFGGALDASGVLDGLGGVNWLSLLALVFLGAFAYLLHYVGTAATADQAEEVRQRQVAALEHRIAETKRETAEFARDTEAMERQIEAVKLETEALRRDNEEVARRTKEIKLENAALERQLQELRRTNREAERKMKGAEGQTKTEGQ